MFRFTAMSGGIPIGGVHFLIELEGKRIAIDCGARQDGGKVYPPPIIQGRVDALLLTHGHYDHDGMLPLFSKEHPNTPIYGTKVTRRFADMILWDSFRSALRKMGRGEKVEMHFSAGDIANALSLNRFRFVHKPEWFSPWPGWKIRFWPAGHINGASSIHIVSPSGFGVVHSGDISFHNQPTIRGAEIVNDIFSPDILITEGTYGDRNLPDRADEEYRFIRRVIEVLKRGGKVLVPAFSIAGSNVGIILANDLAKAGINIPVHIDGMIRTAARIINGSNEWSPNDNGLCFPKNLISIPEDPEECHSYRQDLVNGGPAVIISSHGMLEGGYANFYLPHILIDPKSAVLIPGYQAEGTGGRRLLELERGLSFRVNQLWIKKLCDVERFYLSAHASGQEISEWIRKIQPWHVIVTHATESAFKGLKGRINRHSPAIRVSGGYNGREISD